MRETRPGMPLDGNQVLVKTAPPLALDQEIDRMAPEGHYRRRLPCPAGWVARQGGYDQPEIAALQC